MTFGMLLTDKAFSELELGPPADSPEVSQLLSFCLFIVLMKRHLLFDLFGVMCLSYVDFKMVVSTRQWYGKAHVMLRVVK